MKQLAENNTESWFIRENPETKELFCNDVVASSLTELILKLRDANPVCLGRKGARKGPERSRGQEKEGRRDRQVGATIDFLLGKIKSVSMWKFFLQLYEINMLLSR
jgi:hypothetical protein